MDAKQLDSPQHGSPGAGATGPGAPSSHVSGPRAANEAPPAASRTGRLRIALVGTGFIAEVHASVLRSVRGVEVTAVCDQALPRAERFARRHRVPAVFGSLDELLAAGVADAAHVLVPPGAHREVAERCLSAGLHVLVEKPLALAQGDVDALEAAAVAAQRVLAVNHNQTFHPALLRLRSHLAAGRLGRLEHIAAVHNVPLRQLLTGDVGHFMFQTSGNILFEQGVHVFSMVQELLGPCREITAATGARQRLGNGVEFVADWRLAMVCERGTADVRLAFGRTMTETTLHAIGTDGAAFVDLQRDACWLRRKTRWLDFLDHARNLAGGGVHLLGRSAGAVLGYGAGLFGLAFPDDPFLRGMRASIADFVLAVRRGTPPHNGVGEARAVLATCERAAAAAGVTFAPPPPRRVPDLVAVRAGEVVVLGGAGTIGRHCVRALRAAGRPLTLVVRRPQLLPEDLLDGTVRIVVGDAADQGVLARAFAGADAVLHLATAAGDDPRTVESAMAAAVAAAAKTAQQASVRRLVYASSTAALWLGGREPVAGGAGPDPEPRARAPYSRAKIAAERELQAAAAAGPTEIVVVRPAIVLGPETPKEHSGTGLWVRDNQCVGWGNGRVPLPLVLVDDCARALVAALDAPGIAGRSYNLAGPVRPTAREYVAQLRAHTGRDYRFHGGSVSWMWLQEVGKHLVKVLARRPREFPSLRDLRSRSFRAQLDCSDAERDLGFAPERDRTRFWQRLFGRP